MDVCNKYDNSWNIYNINCNIKSKNMQNPLIKLLTKILRETADKLDAGNSELTEEESMDILSVLTHKVLSKEQACDFVGLKPSQFNLLMASNKLPKGKKRKGFKELVWYEDELRDALTKVKLNKKS